MPNTFLFESKEEKKTIPKLEIIAFKEKTQSLRLPSGEIATFSEVSKRVHSKTLPYGMYEGNCDVIGPLKLWGIPLKR